MTNRAECDVTCNAEKFVATAHYALKLRVTEPHGSSCKTVGDVCLDAIVIFYYIPATTSSSTFILIISIITIMSTQVTYVKLTNIRQSKNNKCIEVTDNV